MEGRRKKIHLFIIPIWYDEWMNGWTYPPHTCKLGGNN